MSPSPLLRPDTHRPDALRLADAQPRGDLSHPPKYSYTRIVPGKRQVPESDELPETVRDRQHRWGGWTSDVAPEDNGTDDPKTDHAETDHAETNHLHVMHTDHAALPDAPEDRETVISHPDYSELDEDAEFGRSNTDVAHFSAIDLETPRPSQVTLVNLAKKGATRRALQGHGYRPDDANALTLGFLLRWFAAGLSLAIDIQAIIRWL